MKDRFHRVAETIFMFVAYPMAIAWALFMIFTKTSVPTQKSASSNQATTP